MGKVSFLFLKSFFLVFRKLLFWQENWPLGYHSMKFRHLRDVPNFLRSRVLSRLTSHDAARIYDVHK